MKRDYWKRKFDLILKMQMEQEQKKAKRRRRKKNKDKEHKRITGIYKHRLKESEFVQKEDEYILSYKSLEIRKFLKSTPPSDLKKLFLKPISWKIVDVLVKRVTIKNLKLLDEFTNWCGCGKGNL